MDHSVNVVLYDPRSQREGRFCIGKGFTVEDLKGMLTRIYGSAPTGFIRDATVYPLKFLVRSPELFASDSDGGYQGKGTGARRMIALFKPSEYNGGGANFFPSNAKSANAAYADDDSEDEEEQDDDGLDDVEKLFMILDLNGDGELHSDEMLVYLTASYELLMEMTSPKVNWTLKAEDLAQATMLDCFNHTKKVAGQRLTFSEFSEWFHSGEENETRNIMIEAIRWYERMRDEHITRANLSNQEAAVAASSAQGGDDGQGTSSPYHISLKDAIEEMQKMTGLGDQHVDDVMHFFKTTASPDTGLIERSRFEDCFVYMHTLRKDASADATEEMICRQELTSFLDRVFNTLETKPGTGVVDANELCSSMCLLCGGSSTDKINAAFRLCDLDEDGFISYTEFVNYLGHVFRFLDELSGEARQLAGCGPNELAQVTAQKAFHNLPPSDSQRGLSFAGFTRWYTSGLSEFDVAEAFGLLESSGLCVGVPSVKRVLGLSTYRAGGLIQYFLDLSDQDGLLHKSSYQAGMERLVRRHLASQSIADRVHAEHFIASIYDICDSEGGGYLDLPDLACTLLLFCGGEHAEKAECAFNLYSGELEDGISETEVAECLSMLLRVVSVYSPEHLGDHEPCALATELAANMLAKADELGSYALSATEFSAWFSALLSQFEDDSDSAGAGMGDQGRDESGVATGSPDGNGLHMNGNMSYAATTPTPSSRSQESQPSQYRREGDEDDGEQLMGKVASELRKSRDIFGFNGVSIDELKEMLGENHVGGFVHHGRWLDTVRLLGQLSGFSAEQESAAKALASSVFAAFTSDPSVTGNYGVPLASLLAGLSFLTISPMEERVMASFITLDTDCDGMLSAAEVEQYIHATLLVQEVCSVSASECLRGATGGQTRLLARAATNSFMRRVDNGADGLATFDEFMEICEESLAVAQGGARF